MNDILDNTINTDIQITAEIVNGSSQSNNPSSVNPNDEITYTITLSNLSCIDLYDTAVFTVISSETTPVPNTVVPPPKYNETLLSGIDIGDVPAYTIKTLTFNVTVNHDAASDIAVTAYANFKFNDKQEEEHSQDTTNAKLIMSLEKTPSCQCVCRKVSHNLQLPHLQYVTDCNVYLTGGNCFHFMGEQIIKIVYGITVGYIDCDECVKSIVTEAAVMFFNPPCNTSLCNWIPRISYPACIDTHCDEVTVSFKVYICK
ncbi:MAG: hypothetical protein RRZ73_05645 [Oscillospiraceae bacterium]